MKKTDSTPPQPQYATPDSTGSTGYDTYPPYEVHFSGGTLKAPIKVTGPHTFALLQPGGGSITVSLSRNPADTGKPNLSITFS